jgi:6-pyruvoyltetrahydropterin/6-carboxytetrahydropterin synthase
LKKETIKLRLYKQNFKFSAAHFLIFDKKSAEKLHGHNYQVSIDIEFKDTKDSKGYLIDFKILKSAILRLVNDWDESVLLPQKNTEMKFKQIKKNSLQVEFRDRYYCFPKNEVNLLPITNTSVEQLSELFTNKLIKELNFKNIFKIAVQIEETQGQSAVYETLI